MFIQFRCSADQETSLIVISISQMRNWLLEDLYDQSKTKGIRTTAQEYPLLHVSGARANQRKCRLSTPKGRKWTKDHSPISCFIFLLMVPPRIQTWVSSLRHPSPLSPKLNIKLPVKVALCSPQKNYKFHGLKPRLFETWTLPLSPNLPNKHIVQGFLRVGMVISLQKFICNDD